MCQGQQEVRGHEDGQVILCVLQELAASLESQPCNQVTRVQTTSNNSDMRKSLWEKKRKKLTEPGRAEEATGRR